MGVGVESTGAEEHPVWDKSPTWDEDDNVYDHPNGGVHQGIQYAG